MIHSININEFRALKNVNLNLGKYVTVISGRNGLCKSTILALLGNTCELKVKEGKSLFNTQFRTEFSEVFKASPEFDLSGSNKFSVNFSRVENPTEINECKISRVSWQDDGTRFRVIPESKINGVKNSRKKEWPSLYLGLSRLYPVGEASDEGMDIKTTKLTNEEEEYFVKNYSEILNLDEDDELCIDMIDIGEVKRKKGVGVNTKNYTSITNSAGQDNIGQIIMAVLSFSRLKDNNTKYEGGLLLIDEIDATLHPIAQIKLIDFLYKACKRLNLQVVCTTHSVSLLEHLSLKVIYNNSGVNNYEIYYMTKNNGPLRVLRNPEFSIIKSDLLLSKPGSGVNRIPLYTEDEEGRWFAEQLIQEYRMYINFIKIKMGCTELIQLNKNDPLYFSNVIFILDGDVDDGKIEGYKDNMIKLPGEVRPEKVIYDFLLNLDVDSELWTIGANLGFNKESIIENGPESNKYQGNPREKYKQWFKDNLVLIENLDIIKYWKKENSDLYNKFIYDFKGAYNRIASRKLFPKLHI